MTLTLPREEIRPAWRAAVMAYRQEYRVDPEDTLARAAAFEAFRGVPPDIPEEQAKMETSQAIAYAAANHTEWFWRGEWGRLIRGERITYGAPFRSFSKRGFL